MLGVKGPDQQGLRCWSRFPRAHTAGSLQPLATPPHPQGQAGRSQRLRFVAELPPDTPGAVGAGHGGHWGPLSPQGPARITGGIQKPLQGKVTVEEAINKPRLCSS